MKPIISFALAAVLIITFSSCTTHQDNNQTGFLQQSGWSVNAEEQKDIQAYSGEFATTGYVGEINEGGDPENNPDGLDEISSSLQGGDRGRIIYHEGQILILRDGKVYDLTGRKL